MLPERMSFYKWPMFGLFAVAGITSAMFLDYAEYGDEILMARWSLASCGVGLLAWAGMVKRGMFDHAHDPKP